MSCTDLQIHIHTHRISQYYLWPQSAVQKAQNVLCWTTVHFLQTWQAPMPLNYYRWQGYRADVSCFSFDDCQITNLLKTSMTTKWKWWNWNSTLLGEYIHHDESQTICHNADILTNLYDSTSIFQNQCSDRKEDLLNRDNFHWHYTWYCILTRWVITLVV